MLTLAAETVVCVAFFWRTTIKSVRDVDLTSPPPLPLRCCHDNHPPSLLFFSDHRALPQRRHVLPPVAAAGTAHPEAAQPGALVQPLHVHGLLPAQLPVGAEALHNLRPRLSGRALPDLLQLLGQLLPVPLPRLRPPRLRPRPGHRGHLETPQGMHTLSEMED